MKNNSSFEDLGALIGFFGVMDKMVRDSKAKMTPEEKAERKKKIAEENEKERIYKCVIRGICPTCGDKLNRGKKDKKNDYKRAWKCYKCNEEYII